MHHAIVQVEARIGHAGGCCIERPSTGWSGGEYGCSDRIGGERSCEQDATKRKTSGSRDCRIAETRQPWKETRNNILSLLRTVIAFFRFAVSWVGSADNYLKLVAIFVKLSFVFDSRPKDEIRLRKVIDIIPFSSLLWTAGCPTHKACGGARNSATKFINLVWFANVRPYSKAARYVDTTDCLL
jgi:hypothetical protein